MAGSDRLARKYDSSRRQEQAARTRLQIARAARRMFLQRGYAGATMAAIAREAGCSTATVYAIFRTKQRLLAALLDASLAVDAHVRLPVAFPGSDQRRVLGAFASELTDTISRAAPILDIAHTAACTETEIARRIRHIHESRLEDLSTIAEHLESTSTLRPGMTGSQVADLLLALSSAETYQLMTQVRGWSKREFATWLADTLTRLLLS